MQSKEMLATQAEVFRYFDKGGKPSLKAAICYGISRATMYRWFSKWQKISPREVASQGLQSTIEKNSLTPKG